MKKQKKLPIKGLKLCLAFLIMLMLGGSFKSNGQIIYTDIEPDTTIYTPEVHNSSNLYYFSLNNDTVDDFWFYARNSGDGIGDYMLYVCINTLNNNAVNVSQHYHYNDTINLIDSGWQQGYPMIFGSGYIGYWGQEENYGYIGLQLINDNDTLLGWVNIEVPVDWKTFGVRIKGYAYNTNPGESILAGQTQLSKNNHSHDDNISVYTHDGNVFVEFNNNMDSPQGTVEIINNQGQKVSEYILNGYSNVVDVNKIHPGIYFVKININQNIVITRKIYIK
jgi:hypothetical protein